MLSQIRKIYTFGNPRNGYFEFCMTNQPDRFFIVDETER